MEILRVVRNTFRKIEFYPDELIDWKEIEDTVPLKDGKCVNVALAVKEQLINRAYDPKTIKFMAFKTRTFFHVWLEIDGQVIDRPSIRGRVVKAPINMYKYGREYPRLDNLWDFIHNETQPYSKERTLNFYLSLSFDSTFD